MKTHLQKSRKRKGPRFHPIKIRRRNQCLNFLIASISWQSFKYTDLNKIQLKKMKNMQHIDSLIRIKIKLTFDSFSTHQQWLNKNFV